MTKDDTEDAPDNPRLSLVSVIRAGIDAINGGCSGAWLNYLSPDGKLIEIHMQHVGQVDPDEPPPVTEPPELVN